MHKKAYSIYAVSLLAAVVLVFSLMGLFLPKETVSQSERRKLTTLPPVTLQSIQNGTLATNLETYTMDHFPFRESFRHLKALSQYYLLWKKDNNGIYVEQGSAAKLLYPLNSNSVSAAAKKFRKIYETYLKGKAKKIVCAVVPDKGQFFSGCPKLDFNALTAQLAAWMDYATLCDLTDTLTLDDYYRTDPHWRQERLFPTAQKIGAALGVSLNTSYEAQDAGVEFSGAYAGQGALLLKPDRMAYLTGGTLDSVSVTNLETNQPSGIYDWGKRTSRDPYSFYLSGSVAIMTLENPNATGNRSLVLFRDSFGSAIAPYFSEAYRHITLIDTRYVSPALLERYVSFADCDVLFLYSTLLLNDSGALKE